MCEASNFTRKAIRAATLETNSEFNKRPVMLQLDKESTKSFQSQKLFNDHPIVRDWYSVDRESGLSSSSCP